MAADISHNVCFTPQPETLDGDMRPGDLIDVLARLKFSDGFQTIKINNPTRDYLLAAVSARRGKTYPAQPHKWSV